jgi:hypothetical protein
VAVLTDDEYSAFVSYLRNHPEAVDELRPLFLTGEVLEMPAQLARLEAKTEGLRQEVIESRAETQRLFAQLTKRIDDLALYLQRHESRHGNYEGELLEARYARNLGTWLRRWIRSPRTIVVDDFAPFLQRVESGALSTDDLDELARADFILSGRRPRPGEGEILAVVKISFTIDPGDVERASRRAAILSRAGYDAVAVVGGYELSAGASEQASRLGVGVDLRQLAA